MPTFTTLSTLRMHKRELDRYVATLNLTDVQVGKDRAGFFIAQCTAEADPLPAVFADVRDQARDRRQGKRGAGGGARGRVQGQTAAPGANGKGVCAQVRTWAEQHPQATVADAVAAFPNANKTTVRIQFNKAHG